MLVLRAKDMNIISTINVDSFPVGMDIKDDNTMLIVTSQGKVSTGVLYAVSCFDFTVWIEKRAGLQILETCIK